MSRLDPNAPAWTPFERTDASLNGATRIADEMLSERNGGLP
jgi:hypothetical protein